MKNEEIGDNQHPIQEIIKKKLNIIYLDSHSQIWDWRLGGCRSEYFIPFYSWLNTLKCIWEDDYSWNGGTWIDDPESNTQNITKDTKLNFLSKCIASYRLCFKPLLSKYGIGWQYRNGCGQGDYTRCTFKWWTLSIYRSHTQWTGWNDGTHKHGWKDKKFLFSKKWKDYDHEYEIGDTYGVVVNKVSEEEFEADLEKLESCLETWNEEEEYYGE